MPSSGMLKNVTAHWLRTSIGFTLSECAGCAKQTPPF